MEAGTDCWRLSALLLLLCAGCAGCLQRLGEYQHGVGGAGWCCVLCVPLNPQCVPMLVCLCDCV